MKNKTFHKRKILVVFAGAFAMIFVLIGRLTYLMVFDAEYYQKKAEICMRGNVTLRLREEKSLTGMGKFWQQTGRYVQFL